MCASSSPLITDSTFKKAVLTNCLAFTHLAEMAGTSTAQERHLLTKLPRPWRSFMTGPVRAPRMEGRSETMEMSMKMPSYIGVGMTPWKYRSMLVTRATLIEILYVFWKKAYHEQSGSAIHVRTNSAHSSAVQMAALLVGSSTLEMTTPIASDLINPQNPNHHARPQ
eukprot:2940066-Rhodomonas_salina.2